MNIREVLKSTQLVNGLDSDLIDRIAELCTLSTISSGEKIVTEVHRNRDIFVLASGMVAVTITVPQKENCEEVIDNLHSGQVFGELSFVDGCPRSATVRADTDCEVLTVPYESLRRLMEEEPTIGFRIMDNVSQIITAKLRKTNLAWRNTLMW